MLDLVGAEEMAGDWRQHWLLQLLGNKSVPQWSVTVCVTAVFWLVLRSECEWQLVTCFSPGRDAVLSANTTASLSAGYSIPMVKVFKLYGIRIWLK